MILTIDVGNTNVVLASVENGKVLSRSRLATRRNDPANDYALKMRQSFELDGIDYESFEGAIMSSVVPQVNMPIRDAVKKLTGLDCLVVGAGIKTGVNIKIDDPGTLGADLITGAVGAAACIKLPAIVVDMGTATTLTLVDKSGAFCGGAIAPGVEISLGALVSGASLLHNIAIEAPEKCIGTNTVDCMKSGVVLGAAAMVDGLIDRMEAEVGEPVSVIATGGIAGCVIPYCRREMKYEPDLLLKGLEIMYYKNVKHKKK